MPARVDDDGAAQLGLGVCSGPEHPFLALCDWPAGTDLANDSAADVCTIRAVEDFAHDDVSQLLKGGGGVRIWMLVCVDLPYLMKTVSMA